DRDILRGTRMTQPEAARPTQAASAPVTPVAWKAAPGEQVVLEHVSPVKAALRRFVRHRLAIVGLIIVSIIILLAIFAPFLTDWPPNKIDFQVAARQPPSATHPL